MIDAGLVKKLREETGLPVMECKRALERAEGDYDRAKGFLAENAKNVAAKKKDRELKAGLVDAYIHFNGKVGALVELGCESDFVAGNDEFKALIRNLCMHVAVADPYPADAGALLEQPYFRDPSLTVKSVIEALVNKIRENITIRRFARFKVGD
jgi:elongation factor Ts